MKYTSKDLQNIRSLRMILADLKGIGAQFIMRNGRHSADQQDLMKAGGIMRKENMEEQKVMVFQDHRVTNLSITATWSTAASIMEVILLMGVMAALFCRIVCK